MKSRRNRIIANATKEKVSRTSPNDIYFISGDYLGKNPLNIKKAISNLEISIKDSGYMEKRREFKFLLNFMIYDIINKHCK